MKQITISQKNNLMKKIFLTLTISILSLISFSQVNLSAIDSLGLHNCDSSQVFLINTTPVQVPKLYYQWEIYGNIYNIGTSYAPFEVLLSNDTFNYALLYAFSDSTYTTNVGIYTLTINLDTCTSINNVDIIVVQDSAFNCDNGIFTLSAGISGGTAPYFYDWSYDQTQTTTPTITDIFQDNSFVQLIVTDINGNTFMTGIDVMVNDYLHAYATHSIITSDCNNTVLQFYGSSNSSTAIYSWSFDAAGTITTSGTPNPSFSFPNSAQYVIATLTVTEGSCTDVEYLTIPLNSTNITGNYAVINNSTNPCVADSCNYEIQLNATSGVAPYTYSIDGGAPIPTNSFTNVCVGTHTGLIVDANGCAIDFNIIIEDSSSLFVQENTYYANCSNSGSNQSYIYINTSTLNTIQWSDGSSDFQILNPTPGTTYTYIVTNPAGCTLSGTIDVPTNNCYTISGNVYADLDGDCIFNNNDYALSNTWVDLANANGSWLWIYDFTDVNGYFSISAPAGTYYFDINGYSVNNFTQNCPASGFSVTIGPNNPNPVVNFYMTPPPPVQDLSINLYSYTTFTPGFPYWAGVYYCNDGTIPMSGNVIMNYDADLTYIAGSSIGAVNDATNNTLTWSFTNLMPGNCIYKGPNFTCSTSATLGSTMSNTVVINPISGDVTPSNNTAYVIDTVVGSWDPNDKAVYPQANMTTEEKDHNYTIRFQNKGTAPATFVIVRDDLDDNLDLQTLRNVSASHNFVLTVENTDELVFTFNNIMLPAEQDDAEASKGSISYTISQKDDLPVGTIIENTAYIYFDFNEAVITNTTANTIVEKTVGIKTVKQNANVNVFPNPSNGLINVNADAKIKTIKVFNLIGKQIFETKEINNKNALLSLHNTQDGIYLLKIETEKGTVIERITIHKK